jgi:hypothetical protein
MLENMVKPLDSGEFLLQVQRDFGAFLEGGPA